MHVLALLSLRKNRLAWYVFHNCARQYFRENNLRWFAGLACHHFFLNLYFALQNRIIAISPPEQSCMFGQFLSV
jgi:hypothetical protein